MTNDIKRNTKSEKADRKTQKQLFRKRLNALFKTEYRYSLNFEETHVFSDGKAYINVDLTKCETPFSLYSYNKRINPEIYDYINQETLFLPVDIPVVVNFDDDGKYDDELKTKIKKAVVRHYSLEYEDMRYTLRKTRIFSAVCALIGVLFLGVYIFLSIYLHADKVVSEPISQIIYILSWVFIWESVDRFAITGFDDRMDVLNAGQLALIEVQFGKPMIK